ncbi:MAG: hypothetical protein Q8P77_03880 [Candidatus Veblenbacteria bacterium]|nr:hypothetical protein [Candidatus Veblenbacteria bacterium]
MPRRSNFRPRIADTKILLYLLLQAGQLAIDSLTALYDIRRWGSKYVLGGRAYVRELDRFKDKERLRRAYRSLKRHGYLTERKTAAHSLVAVTNKGKAAILRQQLRQAPVLPKGEYTVVIFDIPETQRLSRRQFRLLLRQSDFIKLQQSVWVSNHDVRGEIANFIKQVKLERWVNVYYGREFLIHPAG